MRWRLQIGYFVTEKSQLRRKKPKSVCIMFQASELKEIMALEGNDHCADCHKKGAFWASPPLGIFICLECAGIHRQHLGVHISKVRSITMDSWTDRDVQALRAMGNKRANEINELNIPPEWGSLGPNADSDTRVKFIICKYTRYSELQSDVSSDHTTD